MMADAAATSKSDKNDKKDKNGKPVSGTDQPSQPSSQPDAEAESRVSVRSVALTLIAIAATMYVLNWAQEAFIPIVVGVLISYALDPVVMAVMRLCAVCAGSAGNHRLAGNY